MDIIPQIVVRGLATWGVYSLIAPGLFVERIVQRPLINEPIIAIISGGSIQGDHRDEDLRPALSIAAVTTTRERFCSPLTPERLVAYTLNPNTNQTAVTRAVP